jgi:hypothetical protein
MKSIMKMMGNCYLSMEVGFHARTCTHLQGIFHEFLSLVDVIGVEGG